MENIKMALVTLTLFGVMVCSVLTATTTDQGEAEQPAGTYCITADVEGVETAVTENGERYTYASVSSVMLTMDDNGTPDDTTDDRVIAVSEIG